MKKLYERNINYFEKNIFTSYWVFDAIHVTQKISFASSQFEKIFRKSHLNTLCMSFLSFHFATKMLLHFLKRI